MKKLMSLALSMTLVFAAPVALAACGQAGGAGDGAATEAAASADATSFATLGDVFAAEPDDMSSTFDEQHYVCAFNSDGTWWRAEAALEPGMADELNAVWLESQDKVEELLSPLAVTKADVLEPLDDEAIASLAGKTGAELTSQGFTFMTGAMVVNGNETDCTATLGDFDYLITFDGAVPDENAEDVADAVADLAVSTASIQGVSWSALES